MTERTFNLVVPLAHEATDMRTTETSCRTQERSGAVSPLNSRQGDVESTTDFCRFPASTAEVLTPASVRAYIPARQQTTDGGFGDPECKAAKSRMVLPCGYFFARARPSMGGPGGEAARPAGCFARFANPARFRSPVWRRVRGSFNEPEQSTMANNAVNPSTEIVKNIFDDHPEDVISPIKSAADTLGWLVEIFDTIKNDALDGRNGYRIKHLAEAGAYLALNMADYVGHMHETYLDRLIKAGVVDEKAKGNHG